MAAADVLSDGNLAWAVALAVRGSSPHWPLEPLFALASVNRAFRAALASEPVHLLLRGAGPPTPQQLQALASSRLVFQTVEWLRPSPGSLDLLASPAFAPHCLEVAALRRLLVDGSRGGRHVAETLARFPALRALELVGCRHGRRPGATVFQSAWVKGLPQLERLALRGFRLEELRHLPPQLRHLDLSSSYVTYEQAVYLPKPGKLASIGLPHGGGGHWLFEE